MSSHSSGRSTAFGIGRLFMLAAVAIAATIVVMTWMPPAHAGIKCVNGFQIVGGSPIATPYCQDELVAKVARQHGMKVTSASIRNNPNLKRNVCQFVGRDSRVHLACIDANSVGRRGF